VGFGDSFVQPLRFDGPGEQDQDGTAYRLTADGEAWTMAELDSAGSLADGYRFTLQPRRLYDFTYACHWMQTAPESPFVRKRICSLARPEGRITLSDNNLIITHQGRREERSLADENEYARVLKESFGIVL
jgi:N-hydroxyarylamine O-acetyltransferase